MAEKIKIGVVGCGGIFNGAHIWAYDRPENENSKAKVVALCDIKIEKAYATAEKLGVDKSHCYEDFKEMIEKAFGEGSCCVLNVRPVGGYEIKY